MHYCLLILLNNNTIVGFRIFSKILKIVNNFWA